MDLPPSDRRYSSTHEWHKVEGNTLTLGLTQFAVDQLTDVTYVEMKKVGTACKAGDVIGTVESVKTTSDIYSALGGEVTAVNAALANDPSLLNKDPYAAGWLIKLSVSDTSGLSSCTDATEYHAKNS